MEADFSKKSLIIVESPTKARTIKKYLGKNMTVMASKGHVMDLAPSPKKGVYGVLVSKGYELEYEIPDEKRKLIAEMKKALLDADQLILATDEDREGECISYHLLLNLKPKCPVFRMVFHEITKKAVLDAFKNCREIDMNLVHAQEARRAIDRLQGYGISPVISRKLGATYSAGRVQSPGLRLLVDKEKERRAFISSDYASLDVFFSDFKARLVKIEGNSVADKNSFDPRSGKVKRGCKDRVLSLADAEKIASSIIGKSARVTSIERSEKKLRAPEPFITSTLQIDASRKMKRSVKQIMQLAQSLYESGFITYMRTDSPTLSGECINASREKVREIFGEKYLSESVHNYKSKRKEAQEAHEAIRPAGDVFRTPEETGLSGDELRLYTIIYKRTLATQMKNALRLITKVELECEEYTFRQSGSTLLFPGFLALYEESSESDEKEESLPLLSENDERIIEDDAINSHTTEPPQRYSEASLVKKLEGDGIGRPSTYASIISTIIDRNYAERVSSYLVPTFTGFFVSNLLDETFPLYTGYDFTSKMETGLDEIASGKMDKNKYLDAFWFGVDGKGGLKEDLERIRYSKIQDAKTLELERLSYTASLAEGDESYSIRTGKFGPYIMLSDGRMSSIDQKKYFPGSFSDSDVEKIFTKTETQKIFIEGTDVEYLEGKYGPYLKRQSDLKIVNLPRSMKIDKLDQNKVNLIYSLPKVVATDEEGKEVVLKLGPYGFYAQFDGKNHKVFSPETFDPSFLFKKGEEKKSANEEVRVYPELEGKRLVLMNGKYGLYVKWGDKNCAIPAKLKEKAEQLSEEDAKEIALSAPEKKTRRFKRR